MTVYRKKPTLVSAEKYTGSLTVAIQTLLNGTTYDFRDPIDMQGHVKSQFFLRTVDGNVVSVPIGAYVVIDAKGFPYPCDAEIFEAGHDKVEM